MVYTFINPATVKDYKEIIQGVETGVDIISGEASSHYDHKFIQVGVSSNGIVNCTTETSSDITKMSTETGTVTFDITALQVTELKSNMAGYSVIASTKQKIKDVFSKGVIIPSQQLDYATFPIPPSALGINSTNNLPVSNLSCISIMFPRHDQDYTVFENPCYNNLQLTINSRNVPDEVLDTTDARFLHYQLVASDLDGSIQCTKEYEDSIIQAKNDANGTRYKNCLSDGTGFMWNVQLERGGAGFCYDGFDSNGLNVPIQIRGQPIYTGDNDTYYNVDAEGTIHPPQIQMWLCRDTYFYVQPGFMKYFDSGSPPGSQAGAPAN